MKWSFESMGLEIEIQKKPPVEERDITKVASPNDVYNLKEVQEIKDAVQEHLLFIGLDSRNNIRNVSLIGVGKCNEIYVDSKYIIRTALITASEKVILVHNHPSNDLEPSKPDEYITNITGKMLKVFNIQLTDHIIVGEDKYLSMGKIQAINNNYEDQRTNIIDKGLLMEENLKLKGEIKTLNDKIQELETQIEDGEEMEL
jgi:DNA repair protein RadC